MAACGLTSSGTLPGASGLPEAYEPHLLSRIAEEEAQWSQRATNVGARRTLRGERALLPRDAEVDSFAKVRRGESAAAALGCHRRPFSATPADDAHYGAERKLCLTAPLWQGEAAAKLAAVRS